MGALFDVIFRLLGTAVVAAGMYVGGEVKKELEKSSYAYDGLMAAFILRLLGLALCSLWVLVGELVCAVGDYLLYGAVEKLKKPLPELKKYKNLPLLLFFYDVLLLFGSIVAMGLGKGQIIVQAFALLGGLAGLLLQYGFALLLPGEKTRNPAEPDSGVAEKGHRFCLFTAIFGAALLVFPVTARFAPLAVLPVSLWLLRRIGGNKKAVLEEWKAKLEVR